MTDDEIVAALVRALDAGAERRTREMRAHAILKSLRMEGVFFSRPRHLDPRLDAGEKAELAQVASKQCGTDGFW